MITLSHLVLQWIKDACEPELVAKQVEYKVHIEKLGNRPHPRDLESLNTMVMAIDHELERRRAEAPEFTIVPAGGMIDGHDLPISEV